MTESDRDRQTGVDRLTESDRHTDGDRENRTEPGRHTIHTEGGRLTDIIRQTRHNGNKQRLLEWVRERENRQTLRQADRDKDRDRESERVTESGCEPHGDISKRHRHTHTELELELENFIFQGL